MRSRQIVVRHGAIGELGIDTALIPIVDPVADRADQEDGENAETDTDKKLLATMLLRVAEPLFTPLLHHLLSAVATSGLRRSRLSTTSSWLGI
jgi:hypothetical protein